MTKYPDLKRDGKTQRINGVLFLSRGDYAQYMINHAAGSWIDYKEDRKKDYKDTKLKRFLRKPSNYDFIEKHFGKKAVHLYEFFSYDLFEYGIGYFIRRVFRKNSKNRKK